MHRRAPALVTSVFLALAPSAPRATPEPTLRARCTGRYADAIGAMNAAARARESRPAADWVYCLRATAVYEHLSYGRGGKVVHEYTTKVRHGTGFAYVRRNGEWLVATNHHVVAFPDVTGDGQELDGVPPGSRRVRTDVRIVANEAEPDSSASPVLRPVSEDERLDLAVLASSAPLALLPYAFGRSADLHVGDAVLVRGYPLGAFAAANVGRVIGLGQRDLERGWDHEDFAVDALLNLGSSGSPVLAVSCETGEPELVGVYHAGYRGAQGLNVVITMDDLRAMLQDPRARTRPASVQAAPRADLSDARAALERGPVVIPFGRRAVRAEREGDAVRFSVLDPTYPLSMRVAVSILDRGAPTEGRPAELRAALWEQLALVLRYRASEESRDRVRSLPVRDRISSRLREAADDQDRLLVAVQAGAEGFDRITTRSDRDPAASGPGPGPDSTARAAVEVILGSR